MKKFIFGILIFLLGLVMMILNYIFAMINPWDYNGITGILGSLLGTNTLGIFIFSILVIICGLYICWLEAYKK